MASRQTREAIEALVESGGISDSFKAAWQDRKRVLDLAKAQKMYAEGRVLDAAKLGFPEAQGHVALWYFSGTNGMEKDDAKCAEWAIKAAEGGDALGQYRLGFATSEKVLRRMRSRRGTGTSSWRLRGKEPP